MTKKKTTKNAAIRSNSEHSCPYGLKISKACRNVGKLVLNMAPVDIMGEDSTEDEKKAIAKANSHLFNWHCPGEKCPFASKVFDKNEDVVECNWNTEVAGESGGGSLVGSPYYYRHFSGIGTDGLYSYPLGYYSDNSIDRGMYMGMYSIEGLGNNKDEKDMKKSGLGGWIKFMSRSQKAGYYIENKKDNKQKYVGPFRSEKVAEFFNYLAFCSPLSENSKEEAKLGIIEIIEPRQLYKLAEIDKKYCHPKDFCFHNTPFGIWWKDTYGTVLSNKLVLKLAISCGAKGYDSFRKWLLAGSMIEGKPAHSYIV
jgi:hypothetical protein